MTTAKQTKPAHRNQTKRPSKTRPAPITRARRPKAPSRKPMGIERLAGQLLALAGAGQISAEEVINLLHWDQSDATSFARYLDALRNRPANEHLATQNRRSRQVGRMILNHDCDALLMLVNDRMGA